jgi:hypothetical protein
MAVTTYATEYSTQVAKHDLPNTYFPGNPPRQPDDDGRLHYRWFEATQGAAAGDATSTIGLCYIPAGRWRALGLALNCSAFGTGRTLDVGYATYTNRDGTIVAADPDAFVTAKDVSALLYSWGFNNATGFALIECIADTLVYSTVAVNTIPVGATLKGYLLLGRAE